MTPYGQQMLMWFAGLFSIFLACFFYTQAGLQTQAQKISHVASYPLLAWSLIALFLAFFGRT